MEIIDTQLLNTLSSYNATRFNAFKNHLVFTPNKEYERLLSARYMKVSRIKKRFIYLITRYDYLYFCTFTFDNDYLKRCERSQRDLIKDVLLKYDRDIKYILNVDYGSKTERLHYHCICATNVKGNLRKFVATKYPFRSNVKKIRMTRDDFDRISKYINKLSNHCCKDSTMNRRIVYNFKGYESLATNKYDEFIMYTIDKESLCFI